MATGLRLLRFNLPTIFNSAFRKTSLNGNVYHSINRFIFSETSLGVNGYTNARLQIHQQFANIESSFRQKMHDIVKNDNSVIFTEDLKVMLHLVNKNPEDIDLIIKMMHKFSNQNKELRFGTFIFGPVVMRAFYYLDEPDIALNAFLDDKLTNFLDQTMSYTILMVLLYNHERYSDVRKVYDIVKERNVDIQRFPRNPLIAVAASCYKENTPESLNYIIDTWRELVHRGFQPVRRVIAFIAALALNQNNPEITLEILMGLRTSNYIDNRCLKILALCKSNRLMDVIPVLRQSIDVQGKRKECYFSDVIAEVEKLVETASGDIQMELVKLISIIKKEGLVEQMTLETHLNKPIENVFTPKNRTNQSQGYYRNLSEPKRRSIGLKDLL